MQFYARCPFSSSSTSHSLDFLLDFNELLHAIIFLGGREQELFQDEWKHLQHSHDGSSHYIIHRRARSIRLSNKSVFRGLGYVNVETWSKEGTRRESPNKDIIDVIAQCQPVISDRTIGLDLSEAIPTVKRLDEGKISLQYVFVSKREISYLLMFFIQMLEGIGEKEAAYLTKQLDKLKDHFLTLREKELSFKDFTDASPEAFVSPHCLF